MTKKLRFTLNGVVVAQHEVSAGPGDVLYCLPYPGAEPIPWPLDAQGDPLPVEIDPRSKEVTDA